VNSRCQKSKKIMAEVHLRIKYVILHFLNMQRDSIFSISSSLTQVVGKFISTLQCFNSHINNKRTYLRSEGYKIKSACSGETHPMFFNSLNTSSFCDRSGQ